MCTQDLFACCKATCQDKLRFGRLLLPRCCCRHCRLLATGGNDTLICIWDLQYGVPQSVIYRPDEAVRALSFSADQSLLAYCQEDVPGQSCNVEIMDVKTGEG